MLCTFNYCDLFVFAIIVVEFLFQLLFSWMLLYNVLHVSASDSNKYYYYYKKKACKNAYLESIFIPKDMCVGCVLKVLLREWYPAWKTSGSPPGL